MSNFTTNLFFLFTLFILVKLNILLLNEESLILGCFILFCSLSTFKLGPQLTSYFQAQFLNIKNNLISSHKQVLKSAVERKGQLSRTLVWPQEFLKLKKHLKGFNNVLLESWPSIYFTQVQNKLLKKLLFSQRLEQQVAKLVSLVIIEKVRYNTTLQQFYTKKLTLKRFKTLEKIYFREHLVKVG